MCAMVGSLYLVTDKVSNTSVTVKAYWQCDGKSNIMAKIYSHDIMAMSFSQSNIMAKIYLQNIILA
jgi:hypothetical protein